MRERPGRGVTAEGATGQARHWTRGARLPIRGKPCGGCGVLTSYGCPSDHFDENLGQNRGKRPGEQDRSEDSEEAFTVS